MSNMNNFCNEDIRNDAFRDVVIEILDKWIEQNVEDDQYTDVLRLCKELIHIFDPNTEMYCDDAIFDEIAKYIRIYEEANGIKFEY